MRVETVFSPLANPGWPDELVRLSQQARREPFDPTAVEFVAALSSHILRSPSLSRGHAELAAVAHWFRRANLIPMAEHLAGSDDTLVRPRGVVFVIAPANVEVMFVYGWLLSLLAGNASIVRVSQKRSPLREAFFDVVRHLAGHAAFRSVISDSWVVTYEHNDDVTAEISRACDARLVWGGDATVAQIRAIPLKPVAVDVAFADRFSFAVFAGDAMCRESDSDLRESARRFANDTLWFAQQACSSPRAVVWVGARDRTDEARGRFWPLYESAAATFENEPAALMSRVTDLFMLAGSSVIDRLATPLSSYPARASGCSTLGGVREIHSGYGMFVEYAVTSLLDVARLVDDKDQTMVVHGFADSEIASLLRALPNRAIDRIVLPGQANDFSTVWDGSDLFAVLTRKVRVPRPRNHQHA